METAALVHEFRAQSPDVDLLFVDVVSRAASMTERRTAPWFAPSPGDAATDETRSYVDDWCALTCSSDTAAFHRLLASRQLSHTDAECSLRRGGVRADSPLPLWARDIAALFFDVECRHPSIAVPTLRADDVADPASLAALHQPGHEPWSLQRVFAPALARGAAALDDTSKRLPIDITTNARRDLLAFLARRLGAVCTPTFVYRVNAADILAGRRGAIGQSVYAAYFGSIDTPSRVGDAWRGLIADFPVLARVLAVAFRQWCDGTAELLAHLHVDRVALATQLAIDPTTQLCACQMGAGDLHSGGRGVALLAFADGSRVVYKPKDLSVTAAFMALLTQLNACGLEPPLRPRAIMCRNTHTWEAFVPVNPCVDRRDAQEFYERFGMLIRLVQLLDGTDFTVDNVLSDGAHPELVDLEMLLSPRLAGSADVRPIDARVLETSWDTPARSGLITAKVRGELGRAYAEVGALALPGPCIAPFRQPLLTRAQYGISIDVAHVYPTFPMHHATPVLHGVPCVSTAYRAEIECGYIRMQQALAVHLADPSRRTAFIATFTSVPVRFLCRDTHIYARLLQTSLTPRCLTDGRLRDLQLERLWRARFPHGAVIEAEVRGIRDLDIPSFTARLSGSSVYDDRAAATPGFFRADGLAKLGTRIERLTTPVNLDSLRSVLHTLAPEMTGADAHGVRAAGQVPRSAPARPARMAYHNAALAIGDLILASAVRDSTECRWMGAVRDPMSGSVDLAPLTASRSDGLSAIALALSGLAACTGLERYLTAARSALRGAWAETARVLLSRPTPVLAGFDFGWPGALAACWHGASQIGYSALLRDIGVALETNGCTDALHLNRLLHGSAKTGSLPSGLAGTVLALAPLRRVPALRRLRAIRQACELGQTASLAAEPWTAAPRDILPDGWHVSLPIQRAVVRNVLLSRRPDFTNDETPAMSATSLELCTLLPVLRRRSTLAVRCVRLGRQCMDRIVSDSPHDHLLRSGWLALAIYRHTRSTADAARLHWALGAALDSSSLAGRWHPGTLLSDRHHFGSVTGLCGYLSLLIHGQTVRPCAPAHAAFHSRSGDW